jgi:uncharacterized membrane protein YdfJ with MMPL/SSD domain
MDIQIPLPVAVSFTGIMVLNQTFYSYSDLKDCYKLFKCFTDNCTLPCYTKKTYLSSNGLSSFVEIRLDFGDSDPFGPSGHDWLNEARTVINAASVSTGIQLALAGGASAEFDIIDKVYGVFPIAIGLISAVVFVLTGLAFRSLVVPFRAVLSIALTLAYVYGCAVWVYQTGVLDFLNVRSLSGEGALSWISPVMAFSVLVGLGLDYDIFLLTRIREFRMLGVCDPGKDENNNVLMGLTLTGGVITAAGDSYEPVHKLLVLLLLLLLDKANFFHYCLVFIASGLTLQD